MPGFNQVAVAETGLEPGAIYNFPHETTPNRLLTPMSAAEIVVAGLRKRYGATQALDGMSFAVRPGLVTRDAVEFRAAAPEEVSR